MNAIEFVTKWRGVTTSERASAQSHFNDLCRMLGELAPHEADPSGTWYAFEKGAEKTGGGDGFADVWKHGHFGWEYKGKRANLDAAYVQLQQYREALDNPPLLVVCDLDRFEIHTNFVNSAKTVYRFSLADLADDPTEPLRVLRAVFTNPETLRPEQTPSQITEAAAYRFAQIARRRANTTQFPSEWNDDQIANAIESIANDRYSVQRPHASNKNRYYAQGQRGGIVIDVIIDITFGIVTGYPIDDHCPGNPLPAGP